MIVGPTGGGKSVVLNCLAEVGAPAPKRSDGRDGDSLHVRGGHTDFGNLSGNLFSK